MTVNQFLRVRQFESAPLHHNLLGCSQEVRQQTLTLSSRWFDPSHPNHYKNSVDKIGTFYFAGEIKGEIKGKNKKECISCICQNLTPCNTKNISNNNFLYKSNMWRKLFSIVQTRKINNINVEQYFKYVLENIHCESIDSLLPYSSEIKKNIIIVQFHLASFGG